ncbi:MAG: phosphopentomutase [Rhodothermales bacterium]|nr:phosphopentomutase [Rhodothermales bacterium]
MLFVTIVLDGVGVGAQPDAHRYGDAGADTLGHVIATQSPHLPHLQALGLGNIRHIDGLPPATAPVASFGKMTEVSAGKDSTTGHWELAGLLLGDAFPTYPNGFPDDLIDAFIDRTEARGVLGNRPESGTVIVEELGERHMETGAPIVYTSADSVFQIAAHVDVIGLEALYEMCRITRDEVCTGPHGVGRVIARPFEGTPGSFRRISPKRKDFARLPDEPTLQDLLQEAGVRTVSIGKVADLFGGRGFTETRKTTSNKDGIEATIDGIRRAVQGGERTFIWVNLIDFDQEYGHRNDPQGFAKALESFDRALPRLTEALPRESRLVITADHGNDPTTPGTDHSREYVPLLYWGDPSPRPLGTRRSFRDHAATVLRFFDLHVPADSVPFEQRVLG